MSDMTPKPSGMDEELRRTIHVVISKVSQYRDETLSKPDYMEPYETEQAIMALIQADRERLYGELVAHRQVLGDGEHLHVAIKLDDINTVFNREGADNG